MIALLVVVDVQQAAQHVLQVLQHVAVVLHTGPVALSRGVHRDAHRELHILDRQDAHFPRAILSGYLHYIHIAPDRGQEPHRVTQHHAHVQQRVAQLDRIDHPVLHRHGAVSVRVRPDHDAVARRLDRRNQAQDHIFHFNVDRRPAVEDVPLVG